jgi:hypothetical protein
MFRFGSVVVAFLFGLALNGAIASRPVAVSAAAPEPPKPLVAVSHDSTLVGTGTDASPLALAPTSVDVAHLNAEAPQSGQVLTFDGARLAWQTAPRAGVDAYATTEGDQTNIITDNDVHVIDSLDLPAGKYLLNAVVQVYALTNAATVSCSLQNSTAEGVGSISEAPSGGSTELPVIGFVELETATFVNLACQLRNAPGFASVIYNRPRMTAMQVQSITVQ